jgi:hypothetical protein
MTKLLVTLQQVLINPSEREDDNFPYGVELSRLAVTEGLLRQ